MALILPFSTEPNGIVKEWHDNGDGTYTIVSRQEVESDILERNKALYTHNDGYTRTRDMQRVGSIPLALIDLWETVEGWNPYHPANADKLAQKLDDIDFRHLRTAPGRLGRKHRHI